MKAGIHPEYHEITVVFSGGKEIKTGSVWGKEGDRLQLDVDPLTHPAWVGGVHLKKAGQIDKFANKFGNFNFTTGKKEETEKDKK